MHEPDHPTPPPPASAIGPAPGARPPAQPTAADAAPGASPDKPPLIRLVAIDLDGTLLTDSKVVSEQTVEALCCLPSRGVRVVIASARPPRSVRPTYEQLKLDTWQINYNGAMIWDEQIRQPVFHRPLRPELAREIVDMARDMFEETVVACEILDQWHTDRESDEPLHTTETGRLFKPDFVGPLDQIMTQPITKLMLLGDEPIILRLEAMLDEAFGTDVNVVKTDVDLLQIMDKRVGKGMALKKVASHYGIPMRHVMAIGDAPNDVGMLQMSGIAVAMDNAHPLVKEAAHWIAPSNNDHGVHAALKRYGLCD